MKVIVDIPVDLYYTVKHDGYFFDDETRILRDAIKKGVVVPKTQGKLLMVSEEDLREV